MAPAGEEPNGPSIIERGSTEPSAGPSSCEASYDVVVVGAGIMGSCAAYACASRGLRVLLIDQFDFLHRKGEPGLCSTTC